MPETKNNTNGPDERARASEERLRLGEAAGGIATFEFDFNSRKWDWSLRAAPLFGFASETVERSLEKWEQTVFVDDLHKIHAAVAAAEQGGSFYVEFRVRHLDGSLHW